MGRLPALSPAQKTQIRAWTHAGHTAAWMQAEFGKHGVKVGTTAIGKEAEKWRHAPIEGKLSDAAPVPDQDRIARLEQKILALEALLSSPVTAAETTIESALACALEAVTRQIRRTDIDPKALPGLLKQLVELTEAIGRLRADDTGDDDLEDF